MSYHENRLKMGEAYMVCNECNSRLYSFDGNRDASKDCPYEKDNKGKCTDKLKTSFWKTIPANEY